MSDPEKCKTCDHFIVQGVIPLALLQDMMIAASDSADGPQCMDCKCFPARDQADHFWMTDDETYLCCTCKKKRADEGAEWGPLWHCLCGGYVTGEVTCPFCARERMTEARKGSK